MTNEQFLAMAREEWRDVPEWEGFYEVSDLGRVRSVGRIIDNGHGRKRWGSGRILTEYSKSRYSTIVMARNGERATKAVHSLVALAFLGPSNGLQVNHINGNSHDNRLINLEYISARDNSIHGRPNRSYLLGGSEEWMED